MNILVIDGQGGKLGCQMVRSIAEKYPGARLMAVGTNSAAAAAMAKAGAHQAAAGENPLIVACRKADIIIGPIGIVIADSLFGEITPAMAVAVAQSDAVRILLPVNRCGNIGAVTDGSHIGRYGQARRRDARVNCILSTDGFSCTIGLCRSEDGAGTEVPLNKPCINTVFCDVMKASLSQKGSRRLFYAIWKELLS